MKNAKQTLVLALGLMSFGTVSAQTVTAQKVKMDRNSGRSSFISNNHDPYIYSSDNEGSSYPFRDCCDLGHLILQPRTSNYRDIIFATGNGTPEIRMIVEGDGDVGIGTTNPQYALDVNSTARVNKLLVKTDIVVDDDITVKDDMTVEDVLRVKDDLIVDDNITAENLTITTSSNTGITVNGTNNSWAGIYVNSTTSTGNPFYGYKRGGTTLGYSHVNDNGTWNMYLNGANRMWLTGSGNLTVDGKIFAEEIEVKDIGADYVFEPDYKLMPLDELEQFVKTEKHLPGIAPASETEQGLELGKFNEKLLEKTEELTLHVIEQQKEINALKAEIRSLIEAQK